MHETESQVILNGSRDISFTMDLVIKDVGLFDQLAREHGVPLELSPLVLRIFKDGVARYGARELSPNIIRRSRRPAGCGCWAQAFPPPWSTICRRPAGFEVVPRGRTGPPE